MKDEQKSPIDPQNSGLSNGEKNAYSTTWWVKKGDQPMKKWNFKHGKYWLS